MKNYDVHISYKDESGNSVNIIMIILAGDKMEARQGAIRQMRIKGIDISENNIKYVTSKSI